MVAFERETNQNISLLVEKRSNDGVALGVSFVEERVVVGQDFVSNLQGLFSRACYNWSESSLKLKQNKKTIISMCLYVSKLN